MWKYENDGLCIKNDGLCIENDGFCIENDGFWSDGRVDITDAHMTSMAEITHQEGIESEMTAVCESGSAKTPEISRKSCFRSIFGLFSAYFRSILGENYYFEWPSLVFWNYLLYHNHTITSPVFRFFLRMFPQLFFLPNYGFKVHTNVRRKCKWNVKNKNVKQNRYKRGRGPGYLFVKRRFSIEKWWEILLLRNDLWHYRASWRAGRRCSSTGMRRQAVDLDSAAWTGTCSPSVVAVLHSNRWILYWKWWTLYWKWWFLCWKWFRLKRMIWMKTVRA